MRNFEFNFFTYIYIYLDFLYDHFLATTVNNHSTTGFSLTATANFPTDFLAYKLH